jgi:homoserine kinase
LLPLACAGLVACVVVHPDQVLETQRSREVLAEPFRCRPSWRIGARLAQFLLGLERGDVDLHPRWFAGRAGGTARAPLVPGFAQVKAAAMEHARSARASRRGPSVFAWFASEARARAAAPAMQSAFADAGFDSRAYVSPVRDRGPKCSSNVRTRLARLVAPHLEPRRVQAPAGTTRSAPSPRSGRP